MMYECADSNDPTESSSWKGHNLLDRDEIHGHTLEIADIDHDGNLDIFTAEQGKWTTNPTVLDNHDATAWIFYGDKHGEPKYRYSYACQRPERNLGECLHSSTINATHRQST
jgi:hypothetical protein